MRQSKEDGNQSSGSISRRAGPEGSAERHVKERRTDSQKMNDPDQGARSSPACLVKDAEVRLSGPFVYGMIISKPKAMGALPDTS